MGLPWDYRGKINTENQLVILKNGTTVGLPWDYRGTTVGLLENYKKAYLNT